jgi:hypothetical protein
MTMSLFSVVWICMLISGVRNSLSPLTGEENLHAFFADLAHLAQAPDLKAARVGQDGLVPLSNRAGRQTVAIMSSPGRIHRWKVLPRMICAPMSSRLRGITPLTVP